MIAAVSVRSTRGPSRAATKPLRSACPASRGSNPPSGPTRRVSGRSGAGSPANARPRSPASRSAVPARGRRASHSSRGRGRSKAGTALRPHCSHAPSAMRRQRASRSSALRGAGRTTPRTVQSGTILATPSSTLFCTARSMRSPRLTPRARTMGSGDSAIAGTGSTSSTRTPPLPAAATLARYSPPRPSNTRTSAPGFRRRTAAAWRPAPGPSASRRSPEKTWARSASTRNRGARIAPVWQNAGRSARERDGGTAADR